MMMKKMMMKKKKKMMMKKMMMKKMVMKKMVMKMMMKKMIKMKMTMVIILCHIMSETYNLHLHHHMPKKIAFLFLIYDIINHEDLWYKFFKDVLPTKFSIYIHYKYDVKLTYFEKYKLTTCIPTKYCDISIVHAHNLLLRKAYEDPDNYKFVNLSQSCIPLKSFNYVYDFLTKDNMGHINEAPVTQCFPRCNSVLKHLKYSTIRKSSNWFILNRRLVYIVINNDTYVNFFKDISCPEEHYFITIINDCGLMDDFIITPNLSNGATTFTNWSDMDYGDDCECECECECNCSCKLVSKDGLKNYDFISDCELKYLLRSPCLFGRKFNKGCRINYDICMMKNKE